MAELLDKETGEVVEVPDEQVGEAFKSGRFGVRKGTRIPVVGLEGEVGTVPVEDIESGSAAAAGFEVADPQRIQEARLESKYGEGAANLQAAGEGVARGLSFGLSDVALRSLGVSEKGLRERRERNPLVSTTTELGGAIAPVLLSGGAGAAGLGVRGAGAAARTGGALRAAGALPRATAALGSRAGQAVTRGLGARGGTLFGRAVSTATEGAVEGAVFGGISTAGQLARGEAPTVDDPDELAELVMTNMGTDALIGGAAGAGFGTGVGLVSGSASAAGRAGRKVFGKLEDTLTKGRKVQDGPMAKQFRQSVGDIEPQQAQENIMTELGRQRRALQKLDETQDATTEKFAKVIDRQEELFNDITSASTIQDKLRTVKRLMRDSEDVADLQTVGRAADDWVTSLREEVDQIVTDVGSFEPRERGAAKRLKQFVDDSQLKIRKATIEGGPDAQAEIFAELDQLKRKAGRLQSRLGGRGAGGSTADDVKFAAGDIIRGKYHEGQELLERADLWGRAAVDVQVPENRAWSQWFDTRSAFQRRFLTDAGGRRTADGFDQVLRADTKKVGSTVKSFGRTESQLDKEILRRTVKSQNDLLDTLASRSGAGDNIRKLAEENSQLSREMLEQMDEAQRIADDVDQFQQRLEDARDTGLPFAEKAVRVGAFVGDKAAGLSRMMSASRQTRDRVRRAAKAALKFPGEAARRTAKAAPLGVAAAAEKQRGQSRRDRYEETMQRVSAFRNDPAAFVDSLAQSVQPFDAVSPEIGGAMSAQASRAITFLAEKAPKPKQSPATLRPDLDKTQRVSDAEMARFLRYARAVEDPQSVIEDIANGDVTREAMESLRTVYPRMYGKLLEDVTEFVGELEEQPSFSTLRHLSTILGQPAHPAFEAQFIAGVQQNYAQRAEQIKEDAPSPSQRSAPEASSSMLTGSQEVAQGLGSAGR